MRCTFNFYVCLCILESTVNKWFLVVDWINSFMLHALLWLTKGQEFCWRLLELHSLKLVAAGIIWVSLKEVSFYCNVGCKACKHGICKGSNLVLSSCTYDVLNSEAPFCSHFMAVFSCLFTSHYMGYVTFKNCRKLAAHKGWSESMVLRMYHRE